MTPYVNDPDFVLHVGDALDVLGTLPDESVHCVVTSPPYWGLRDYGTGSWDGGDDGCDHASANPSAEHEANRQRAKDKGYQGHGGWEGRASRSDGKSVCKCGARRVDHQLGLEPSPDCGKRGLFRLRSDLTVEQREFVARRLAGVESPDA
jgi:hypothetical protein